MLAPKKVKHRKWHKRAGNTGSAKVASARNRISFGSFGMVALGSKWITARQIEAARRVITRKLQKGGKIWIRIFPDMPYTKKPAETRQGKGKGAPEGWVAVVKTGAVMFEMGGVEEELAREALALAASKLPIKTKFVVRREVE